MAWGDLLHTHTLESGDDAPYAVPARPTKMEPTQDEVDVIAADLFGSGHHPVHSGMSATGDYDKTLWRPGNESLLGDAGSHLPCGPQTRQNLYRLAYLHDSGAGGLRPILESSREPLG
jgi:hypothetical protein